MTNVTTKKMCFKEFSLVFKNWLEQCSSVCESAFTGLRDYANFKEDEIITIFYNEFYTGSAEEDAGIEDVDYYFSEIMNHVLINVFKSGMLGDLLVRDYFYEDEVIDAELDMLSRLALEKTNDAICFYYNQIEDEDIEILSYDLVTLVPDESAIKTYRSNFTKWVYLEKTEMWLHADLTDMYSKYRKSA